jgi:hypothetical protein
MRNLSIVAAVLFVFALIPRAYCAEVRFGNLALRPDSIVVVPVFVTGGQLVTGLDFAIQVGDGGVANHGTSTKPIILALDTTGPNTVFASSNLGSAPTPNGGLMWIDSVLTNPAVRPQVPAVGVLAWITFDTRGTALNDSYAVRLDHVSGSDLSTAFVDPTVLTTIVNGTISIKNSDAMTWSKPGDGSWREIRWTGSTQDYPDYITNAIINTARTVTIDHPSPSSSDWWTQSVSSLSLSNGGKVHVNALVELSLAAASQINAGSLLEVDGALDADRLTLAGGTLRLSGSAEATVSDIFGSGTIQVGDSATLYATSIQADTLSIGGVYGAAAASDPMQAVPEPASIALAAIAAICFCGYFLHRKLKKRRSFFLRSWVESG